MVAISSAIASASERGVMRVMARNHDLPPASSDAAEPTPPPAADREAIHRFYASLYVGLWLVNVVLLAAGIVLYMAMRAAGVDEAAADTFGRWFWATYVGSIVFHGLVGWREEIAERPHLDDRLPSALRTPSDLHLLVIPLVGAPFLFVLNPFLP